MTLRPSPLARSRVSSHIVTTTHESCRRTSLTLHTVVVSSVESVRVSNGRRHVHMFNLLVPTWDPSPCATKVEAQECAPCHGDRKIDSVRFLLSATVLYPSSAFCNSIRPAYHIFASRYNSGFCFLLVPGTKESSLGALQCSD